MAHSVCTYGSRQVSALKLNSYWLYMVENSRFALTQTNSAEIQFPIHLLHNGHLKKKTGELTSWLGGQCIQIKCNKTLEEAWLHILRSNCIEWLKTQDTRAKVSTCTLCAFPQERSNLSQIWFCATSPNKRITACLNITWTNRLTQHHTWYLPWSTQAAEQWTK